MGFLRNLFGAAKLEPLVIGDIQQLLRRTAGARGETEGYKVYPKIRTCFVSVSVRNSTHSDESWRGELGEFHEVWKGGISIGSDPACTVVLPSSEVAPVAVRVVAASNHKFLYRMPPGTALPLPPVFLAIREPGERIDYREFQVGPYAIRFAEVYRGG